MFCYTLLGQGYKLTKLKHNNSSVEQQSISLSDFQIQSDRKVSSI